MKRMISTLALTLTLTLISPVAAGQLATGRSFGGPEARAAVPAIAATGTRPIHAVLRYDLSTAGSCRAFSDQPVELCVLLALHVIHMSEKPQKAL
ncbi:MAG TPA: hypothetical protein VMF67_00570 [Rhizomicrobium sp.]|nr:hypothetical protein [Rhizomicrobium sp.]